MGKVHGGVSEVAERDEQEFTVAVPGKPPEQTEVLHPAAPEDVPLEDTATAEAVAPPASRVSRIGAALFWMAVGWWLFAAVRVGVEVVGTGYIDGTVRQIPGATLLDIVREATDRGREELLALVALSVLAALVLLVSRGRRALGLAAAAVAAATVTVGGWHLVS